MNVVAIMGRLTQAPELKTTSSGTPVTSFSVAVSRPFKDKATGEYETDFFNVVAWRKTAEFISRYFNKGQMIAISGRLQQRSYTDKNGIKRYVVEIIAEKAGFAGAANKETEAGESRAEQVDEFDGLDINDTDLPF